MSMTFKYKKLERPAPAGTTYVPYIPVTLIGTNDHIDVMALLDSGADISVLPRSVADLLGIEITGEKQEVVGIGGKMDSIETAIEIIVQGPHEKYQFRMKTKVILDDTDGKFPIILGRSGFFDKFDITFVERHRKIMLKKPN